MANKFVSLLDHIGEGLKKFFTSPVAATVENFGISIAEAAWPGLTPFLSAISASLAKAQALAAAANVSGDTTPQVVALTLSDAQQAFAAYEAASGTKLETAQQQTIVNLVLQLLQNLPAPTNTVPAAASASGPAASAPAPGPVAVPAAATGAVALSGDGLHAAVQA